VNAAGLQLGAFCFDALLSGVREDVQVMLRVPALSQSVGATPLELALERRAHPSGLSPQCHTGHEIELLQRSARTGSPLAG
jgi:hypothetical protein